MSASEAKARAGSSGGKADVFNVVNIEVMSKVQPTDGPEKKPSEKAVEGDTKVPYSKLFSQADSFDVFLMCVGTMGALANGEP